MDTFSKQSWKGLRTLKISSRNVSDKGAISLGSSMPPMLGHLTFQFTTIGDKGVERLIASPPPTLLLLDLSGTKMTDKGAMLCKSLTSLSSLILPKEISEDVIADLQKALPEAKVYRD